MLRAYFKQVFFKLISFGFVLFHGSYSLLAQEKFIPENVIVAIEQDIKAAAEYRSKSDYNQAAHFYSTAANSYWNYGHLEKSKEQFLNALEMQEQIGNFNGIYAINTNLGLINTDLSLLDKALDNFIVATDMARKLNRKSEVASSVINQANILFEINRINDALTLLDNSLLSVQELNDPRLLRNAYSLYTKVYDRMGKHEESSNYFQMFAAISRSIQQQEMRKREEEAMQLVNQATSRVRVVEAEKQATEKELVERDMELIQKQRFLEQAEQQSRERLMQIDLLNKEKELQQAVIMYQEQMRKIYIAVIIIIFAFSAYIYYNYQEKRKANVLLQQKNDEISRQNIEIQAQSEQLKELNQLKDKLFSIISHDLRSPLGSLITLLNLTQQGYFTEEGFKAVVDELSKNVGYTSQLLENLLKWAQSQMDGLKVKPSLFNLYEVANSKFQLYVDLSNQKQVELINNIDPEIVAFGDSDMVELVLRNLIANAIKFCNKGGVVTASATLKGNKVVVTVSDTGIGISPENLKKLFGREIFTTYGTNNEKGTGLGLILCKDFIALNGGDIWANSTEGKGSEFVFTLPLRDNRAKREDVVESTIFQSFS